MTSDATVVIRPRRGGAPDRRRLWFALAFLPLAVGGVVQHLRVGHGNTIWYVAAFACLALLTLGLRADFFAQTSLTFSGDLIRRTGYFGRSATCRRAAVSRVVEAELIASRIGAIPATWLLFLDASGRTLLRAYADYYPAAQLSQFRDALDVRWDRDDRVRTFAQMRREIPKSFPWTLAHIWITTIMMLVAAFVIVSVVASFA